MYSCCDTFSVNEVTVSASEISSREKPKFRFFTVVLTPQGDLLSFSIPQGTFRSVFFFFFVVVYFFGFFFFFFFFCVCVSLFWFHDDFSEEDPRSVDSKTLKTFNAACESGNFNVSVLFVA